ncbi:copper transporter 5.1-like protein, partial [Tanacetum coccineum]
SKDEMKSMSENGPWLIRNVPLILKKWTPDANRVMSFNGGVFVAIVVGLAVGYWLFRNADDEKIMLIDDSCACG